MPKNPLRFFRLIVVLTFAAILMRLFQLQFVERSKWVRLSEENRVKLAWVRAPRGRIFDCEGRLMVSNRSSYSLTLEREIDPSILHDLGQELEIGLRVPDSSATFPLTLARDVGIEVASYVEEHNHELPNISVETRVVRNYPHGTAASHAIGYIGEISQLKHGYVLGDQIGLTGIEKHYESYLRGQNGMEFVEVDARGREIRKLDEKTEAAVPGADLHLTLDARLQSLVEEELRSYGVCAAVAVNPWNGAVLALLSKPNFDPNRVFIDARADYWKELIDSPHYPLWNRAVSSGYPPGSVFKIPIAVLALEKRIVSTSAVVECGGGYQFGNRFFRCWETHGRTDFRKAVVRSCDSYFYRLGEKLGVEGISRGTLKMGFGELTGIDLPSEKAGLIPTKEWYDARYGKRGWSRGVALNLSIGQGEILATPIQLARFTAAMANGGTLYRPFIVREIIDRDGRLLYVGRSRGERLVMSQRVMSTLRRYMRDVVSSESGTGALAMSSLVQIAGKTGTAENPSGEDHAIFCCFAPYDEPEIALCLIIERGGHGGVVAAPVAKRIVERYLCPKDEEQDP
jgi:penicillin-binding protein 2